MDQPHHPLTTSRSRRQFLTLAGSAAVAAFLAACGGDSPSDATATGTTSAPAEATPTPTATAAGPWEYTDARGKTVTLDQAPERVVAWVTLAAAMHDFGVESVGIFGPSRTDDGGPTPQAGRLDLDALESLTNGYREVDLERLAVLKPDIFLVAAYGGVIWPIPEEEIQAIERIVPVVAIGINLRPANEVMADIAAFAESLAAPRVADADQAVAEARATFEAASDALRAATAEKPDLSMIVLSPSPETIWVARWDSLADLRYFNDLGVNFYPRLAEMEAEGFTPQLTWETVNTYLTDAILLDARPQWQVAEEDIAGTWHLLPAVQADQLGNWRAEVILSYQGITPALQEMAEQVKRFSQEVVQEPSAA